MLRSCKKCGEEKPITNFSPSKGCKGGRRPTCRACEYPPGYHREKLYKKRYGISIAEYDTKLNAQNGRCAVCGSKDPGRNKDHFCVDHNHTTGQVRGLLCSDCNAALGLLQDSTVVMASALNYLHEYSQQSNAGSSDLPQQRCSSDVEGEHQG